MLDLAEAHHSALRDAGAGDDDDTLQAAADFLRESLSTFETVHRGYLEVQEVARLEHEYVEQLRALADASVAINSVADRRGDPAADRRHRARGHPRCARATVAVLAPDPRLRPLTATSPPRLGGGDPQPARLHGAADRPRQGARRARGRSTSHDREFTARDEAILTQLAQLA